MALPLILKKRATIPMNNTGHNTDTKSAIAVDGLFDLSILAEIDDHEYLLEMIDVFIWEAGKELKEMKEALRAGNDHIVYQKAHKVKSNAGIIQANKLTEILDDIELLGKKGGNKNELTPLVENAVDQYLLVEKALKKYVKANKV